MRISCWSSDVCSSDLGVVVERRRIPVEVDEHETGEHDTVNLAQADIAVLQLAATELLTFQHELIVAVQVPAPAVERADDVPVLESALQLLRKRRTTMRADVVVCLDLVGLSTCAHDRSEKRRVGNKRVCQYG